MRGRSLEPPRRRLPATSLPVLMGAENRGNDFGTAGQGQSLDQASMLLEKPALSASDPKREPDHGSFPYSNRWFSPVRSRCCNAFVGARRGRRAAASSQTTAARIRDARAGIAVPSLLPAKQLRRLAVLRSRPDRPFSSARDLRALRGSPTTWRPANPSPGPKPARSNGCPTWLSTNQSLCGNRYTNSERERGFPASRLGIPRSGSRPRS